MAALCSSLALTGLEMVAATSTGLGDERGSDTWQLARYWDSRDSTAFTCS